MYKPVPGTCVNFIPISGPATRRPAGEWERTVRASLGFVPRWFTDRSNVRFDRQWHEDCEYRYASLVQMKTLLNERFPSVPEFLPRDNGHGFDADCATLSGVYGSKFIAMLYGFPVVFPRDDWPGDASNAPLPLDALKKLLPLDLDDHPLMRKLEEQMDRMEAVFGSVGGFLNYQGVLNTALKLRGSEIFVDMIEDEGFVDALFDHIEDTMTRVAKRVQARQRRSGQNVDLLSLSNCVVNMISPAMYERFALPHDRRISERFPYFGIHTCNWDATPYLNAISTIERMGYLDMGAMSDLCAARRMFPNTRLAVMVSPVAFTRMPIGELLDSFRDIAMRAAPCDVVLADLPEDTDDARVNQVLEYIDRLEEEFTV